jgi:ketosteroid isomerase-like protein
MASVGEPVTLTAGELGAWRQGDVGWVADQPTIKLGDAEVICRHTSVFVRELGHWRIVQHHFSIGVPNEDAFGKEAARFGCPPRDGPT